MEVQWCWRCKRNVPMLDHAEWSQLWATFEAAKGDGRQAALNEFERLTGQKETNFNALFDHQISRHGPPCPNCGKVLRTPVAYKCFECGCIIHAPDWSLLFIVAGSGKVAGRGTFVLSDRTDFAERLNIGDSIEIWESSRLVVRCAVQEIETLADLQAGKHKTTLWLSQDIPEIKPGYAVRFSPPRRGGITHD